MIAAQQLKDLRLQHKYTQHFIAFELGVSQKTYSNMENGKAKINLEHVTTLANIYNVGLTELVGILTNIDANTVKTITANNSEINEEDLYNGINANLSNELIFQLKAIGILWIYLVMVMRAYQNRPKKNSKNLLPIILNSVNNWYPPLCLLI